MSCAGIIKSAVDEKTKITYAKTMHYCLLSAQGPNRAGLVAEISGLLHQAQVNIMDSSMTTLRGEFVMMLLLEIPEDLALEELQTQGKQLQALHLYWQPLTPEEARATEDAEATGHLNQPSHAISVIGPDQTGLVHEVSTILAQRQLNICNVETQLLSQKQPRRYAIVMEIQAADTDLAALKSALDDAQQRLGVDIHLHPLQYAEM